MEKNSLFLFQLQKLHSVFLIRLLESNITPFIQEVLKKLATTKTWTRDHKYLHANRFSTYWAMEATLIIATSDQRKSNNHLL